MTLCPRRGTLPLADKAPGRMLGSRLRQLVMLGLASFLLALPAARAKAQTVWFAPVDPVAKYAPQKGEKDFMQLFADPAAWRRGLRRVKVIQFYTQYIDQAPDDQLKTIFQFLREHDIALAMETWVLHGGPNNCGRGEGYLPNAQLPTRLAQRIKALGGDLAYVTIDESFGGNRGPAGCHLTSAAAAADAAATFAVYRTVFPQVRIGDTENLPLASDPGWFADYAQWADAFQKASGMPFAYFHMDVAWNSPTWDYSIATFNKLLAQRRIPFGVIFNATQGATSNAAWMSSAEENIDKYRAARLPRPAQVVFETWDPYPTKALPESSPTSHTYLIDYYFKHRPHQ